MVNKLVKTFALPSRHKEGDLIPKNQLKPLSDS